MHLLLPILVTIFAARSEYIASSVNSNKTLFIISLASLFTLPVSCPLEIHVHCNTRERFTWNHLMVLSTIPHKVSVAGLCKSYDYFSSPMWRRFVSRISKAPKKKKEMIKAKEVTIHHPWSLLVFLYLAHSFPHRIIVQLVNLKRFTGCQGRRALSTKVISPNHKKASQNDFVIEN